MVVYSGMTIYSDQISLLTHSYEFGIPKVFSFLWISLWLAHLLSIKVMYYEAGPKIVPKALYMR